DADGHDLAVADPDAGIARQPARLNAEVGEGVDQANLEVAQVEADVRCGAQIEDRIADQLAGTVIGDVAAAIDLEARDAARRKFRLVEKDVVAGATPADGVGVRMLEQNQRVGDQAGAALVCYSSLEVPGFLIRNPAEPANLHDQPAAARAGPWL